MENLIVLSIGSNVGDKVKNIKDSVSLIEKEFKANVKKSPVYDTEPLYYEDQENFYNCCVTFKSDLSAKEIFKITASIEKRLKRKRGGIPQGPRTIDIDIVFVGDQIIADESLTIPHPCMQDRLFVLKPLCDIMPKFVHPALLLSIEEILQDCPDASHVEKIKGFWKKA